MANTWQGAFPHENLALDGYERTSPVTAFPPNGYGVHDMIGNVWEWTTDWYSPKHEAEAPKACCIPANPRGGPEAASYDPRQPNIKIPRKVLKGGSHLCAPNYCRRYRPAARHPEPVDTSTSHVGFRCVVRKYRPCMRVTRKLARARGHGRRSSCWHVCCSCSAGAWYGGFAQVQNIALLGTSSRAHWRADDVPLLPAAGDGGDRGAA